MDIKTISVVVPAHNEEAYLPYLLGSMKVCPIHEAIFVLDHTDNKCRVIIENARLPFHVRIIELKTKHWHNPIAEPVAMGCKNASGDIIYVANADHFLHPKIFKVDVEKLDVWSFNLMPFLLYGSRWKYLKTLIRGSILKTYEGLVYHRFYSTGLYAFKKSVYKKIQHQDYDSEDALFLNTAIRMGFHYKYSRVGKSLHLRPDSTRNIAYKARLVARSYKPGLLKTMWYCVKHLDVIWIREYVSARIKTPNDDKLSGIETKT